MCHHVHNERQSMRRDIRNNVVRVGYVPYENRSCVHQQDYVQDSRGISGSLVASTHGSAMHFTKTMIVYEQ